MIKGQVFKYNEKLGGVIYNVRITVYWGALTWGLINVRRRPRSVFEETIAWFQK